VYGIASINLDNDFLGIAINNPDFAFITQDNQEKILPI